MGRDKLPESEKKKMVSMRLHPRYHALLKDEKQKGIQKVTVVEKALDLYRKLKEK